MQSGGYQQLQAAQAVFQQCVGALESELQQRDSLIQQLRALADSQVLHFSATPLSRTAFVDRMSSHPIYVQEEGKKRAAELMRSTKWHLQQCSDRLASLQGAQQPLVPAGMGQPANGSAPLSSGGQLSLSAA